jgi:RNA-directed DNA polymerase
MTVFWGRMTVFWGRMTVFWGRMTSVLRRWNLKRVGNLIEKISSAPNVHLAFLKACRGKRGKQEVIEFIGDFDKNLNHLGEELSAGCMDWGAYHQFQVHDPKPRLICAAPFRSRVAQHAIMNICEPSFESYQIFHSYACRKQKGQDKALKKAMEFSRQNRWYLKMDIRHYFDSVDHEVLKGLLSRRFKDKTVLRLFTSIIDSWEVSPGRGIPIGNLISQFFANHYLGVFDHFAYEDLGQYAYLRYMDDFVIFSDSRQELLELLRRVKTFLEETLKLGLKPIVLNRCEIGMTFLGFKVFPHSLRLSRRSRLRFRRKFNQYEALYQAGIWTEEELQNHLEPMLAFVRRSASQKFRERILNIENRVFPEARTE